MGCICACLRSPCHGRGDARFLVDVQRERPRHSRSTTLSSDPYIQLRGLARSPDSRHPPLALPCTMRFSWKLLAAICLSTVGHTRGRAKCHPSHKQFHLFAALDARRIQLASAPACGTLSPREFAAARCVGQTWRLGRLSVKPRLPISASPAKSDRSTKSIRSDFGPFRAI
jgi:hypothetical protein